MPYHILDDGLCAVKDIETEEEAKEEVEHLLNQLSVHELPITFKVVDSSDGVVVNTFQFELDRSRW